MRLRVWAARELSEAAVEGKWLGLMGAAVEVDLANERTAADDSHGADRFISREEPAKVRDAAEVYALDEDSIPAHPVFGAAPETVASRLRCCSTRPGLCRGWRARGPRFDPRSL